MFIPYLTNTHNKPVKKSILISAMVCLLCSCQKEVTMEPEYGWLCIESIGHAGTNVHVSTTKGSVDSDFSISILTLDGQAVPGCSYQAGTVPGKIRLQEGSYRLEVASSNINDWRSAFSGKGAAAYKAQGQFDIEADMYRYVKIQAPLVNYGVRFAVDNGLYKWFKSFSIDVTESPARKVLLLENECGWFDAPSVSVVISATNTDGDCFQSSPLNLDTQAGHLYTLHYSLSASDEGRSGIQITIDDQFDDSGEDFVIIG